ncbi:MAG: hypothetical protein ABSA11_09755 [Candidatus Bathyarchaeia archaeon]|jgi:hypothetical protein
MDLITTSLPTGTQIKNISFNQEGVLVCGEMPLILDTPPPPLHSVAFFEKIDSHGRILWLQKYWGDEHNSADAFIEVQDGYLLVGSAYSRYGSTFMIIKTDTNGNPQWIRYSGDGQQVIVKSISITGNGMYLINGVIKDWDYNSIQYKITIDVNGNMMIS